MTSYSPDLNVWLALSVASHPHTVRAWQWLDGIGEGKLLFSRYTQIGLLRLLTNSSIMGDQTLTLRRAWGIYDRWLEDTRTEFCHEPRTLDTALRAATRPFLKQAATKVVGDCYLLAFAVCTGSVLITFDRTLRALAERSGVRAVIPG